MHAPLVCCSNNKLHCLFFRLKMFRGAADPRDMKAASVVSDENGYYDSQNIISVLDVEEGVRVLSCILHHSRNHEGGKGLTLCSTRLVYRVGHLLADLGWVDLDLECSLILPGQ